MIFPPPSSLQLLRPLISKLFIPRNGSAGTWESMAVSWFRILFPLLVAFTCGIIRHRYVTFERRWGRGGIGFSSQLIDAKSRKLPSSRQQLRQLGRTWRLVYASRRSGTATQVCHCNHNCSLPRKGRRFPLGRIGKVQISIKSDDSSLKPHSSMKMVSHTGVELQQPPLPWARQIKPRSEMAFGRDSQGCLSGLKFTD